MENELDILEREFHIRHRKRIKTKTMRTYSASPNDVSPEEMKVKRVKRQYHDS